MKIFRASLAILYISSCSAAVVNLTTENYAELTDGKTVFIKFFAPWCGHCKAMAGDWEQLGADWDSHEIGMVAEIDCTAEESQDLCDTIEGFPTLRYGDASDLEDYNGGRTYEELVAFAKDTLSSKVCSVKNIDVCSDEKKAQIEKYMAMDFESLVAAIEVEEEKVNASEEKVEQGIKKLQETYEALIEEHQKTVQQVNDSGLKLMTAVARSKAPTDEARDEL